MYKLPSIERRVRYLHGAAGHPPEDTWVKAVGRGNYNLWLLINTKNVRKYIPELEEKPTGAHARAMAGCVIDLPKTTSQH